MRVVSSLGAVEYMYLLYQEAIDHISSIPHTADEQKDEYTSFRLRYFQAARDKAYIPVYHCEIVAQWNDMLTDCWVCKNCLCVQLCPDRHEKLQTDDFNHLICNKTHKML